MTIRKDSVLDRWVLGNQGLIGGSRSIKDIIESMNNTTRHAVLFVGDSTCRHHSYGWAAGINKAMQGWTKEAGKILPINANGSFNQNGDGMIDTRRRDNFSSKLGISQSLPSAWDGYYIQHGSGWVGPEPALLDRTTITNNPGAAGTTIDVVSTAGFPSSGRLRCESEVIQYTGKTATSFLSCNRGNISTTADAHDVGTTISLCSLGNSNVSWNIDSDSGLNSRGNMVSCLFYTPHGAFTGSSSFTLSYRTADSFEQTAALTFRHDGSPFAMTGSETPGGDYGFTTHGYVDPSTQMCMTFGGRQWISGTFIGVTGPGLIRSIGVFDADRETGYVSTFPISQGGKRLNQMLSEELHTTNNKNGFYRYLWDYAKIRNSNLGGNNTSRLTVINCWGHNESGTNGCSGFVDPSHPWTIMKETYVVNDNGTSIELNDATGLNTTAMAGGHVLINNERIRYTTLTGNTISGLTRGFAGTNTATHSTFDPVYQGYPVWHPEGLATDLLFFYNLVKAGWTSNPTSGGSFTEDQIDFVWVRPVCMSDAPVVVDDMVGANNRHEKEYKFQRYAKTISDRLSSISGFVLFDPSLDTTYADRINNNWTHSEADDVHDNYNGYYAQACRSISRYMRGGGKRSPSV